MGNENINNLLLVSNMWDALSSTINLDGCMITGQEVGEMRERELCSTPEFWGKLIGLGASISRHRGDSRKSAHAILSRFLPQEKNNGIGRPMKLLLQCELVDQHLRLEETVVGQFINDKLYEGQKLLEKEIEDLKRKHQRALDGLGSGSGSAVSEIGSKLEEKKKGLNEARRKAEILGKRVDELVDDHGNKATTPIGRTSGSHAGLCNVM